MKRILCILVVLTLILGTLAGCKKPKEDTVYTKLTELASEVDGFTLRVSTTAFGETLDSTYTVNYTNNGYTAAYTYSELKKIDLNDPEDGYKTEKSGTAVIEGGEVKSHTGDEINALPGRLSLTFNEHFFSNVSEGSGEFTASVTNPKGFTGNGDAKDMNVEIQYDSQGFIQIKMNYTTDISEVNIIYTFA